MRISQAWVPDCLSPWGFEASDKSQSHTSVTPSLRSHPLNFITQVELKALLNRLLMLLRSGPLSAADLQKAAEIPSADPRPPVCRQLVRRLLLSLLLWTPEGHAVAWEAVTHVSRSFSKLHRIRTL